MHILIGHTSYTNFQMQTNACKHIDRSTHTHTNTDTFDWNRLYVTAVSSSARAAIQKAVSSNQSVCPCMCALSLLAVRYHWGGMLHRALYCLTYGFCSSALSRKQGQAGSLRMEPLGLMQFPSSPVVFNVSRAKLGYWWGSANGVTGPIAGSLCCVLVCC